MVDVIQTVREIVESIDEKINGTVSGKEITTCNKGYAMVGCPITINGQSYKIVSVTDSKIVVDKDITTNSTYTISLKKPVFVHGTVRSYNSEHLLRLGENGDYPVVFLLEELNYDTQDFRVPYAKSDVSIFFIAQTNDIDNYMEEHHTNEINPLQRLCGRFLDSYRVSPLVESSFKSRDRIHLHPMLAYTDRNGHTKKLFDDQLSAVRLDKEIGLKKNVKCCTN